MLGYLKKYCKPLFIFDNVESFQIYDEEKEAWIWNLQDEQNKGRLEILQTLHQSTPYPIIVTGRYPLAEFADWTLCNLNTVPFGDFFKKCWQLPFSALADVLEKEKLPAGTLKKTGEGKTSFEAVVKLLHTTLGGNYRALEFFDELYAREKDQIVALLDKLDQLKDDPTLQTEVLHRMSENLVFEQLLSYLNGEDRDTLSVLARYRIPVLPMAVGLQREAVDRSNALARLTNLTLVEQQAGIDARNRYYVAPLVRELLEKVKFPAAPFSKTKAGEYHEYVYDEDLYLNWLDELSEAFEWYYEAQDVDSVNRAGMRLNRFYYDSQQFRLSLVYGLRTEEIAQEATHGNIWNNLGLTFKLYGQLEPALHYYEKSLEYYKKQGDRKGEGITLNNISQIYDAKGEYDSALRYLEQSLRIAQEIGDRKGEGSTLNNLATTAHAKGEYDTALRYLEQSLRIQQEIGDRKGEGITLNNISQIYDAKGEYDTALRYLEQSLRIQQEIGDRQGEGSTLNNISQIYAAKGDYDTALRYLQESLKIRQEIGDLSGMAISLGNIGQLKMSLEKYEEAVSYVLKAYQIFEHIGSPNAQIALGDLNAIAEQLGEAKVMQIIEQLNQKE